MTTQGVSTTWVAKYLCTEETEEQTVLLSYINFVSAMELTWTYSLDHLMEKDGTVRTETVVPRVQLHKQAVLGSNSGGFMHTQSDAIGQKNM